jgi:ubiquinone biosynthesis protein
VGIRLARTEGDGRNAGSRHRSSNRLSFAIVIGAMVVGSSVMVHAAVGPQAFGYPLVGVAGFVVAGLLGIGLAIGVTRSGRL